MNFALWIDFESLHFLIPSADWIVDIRIKNLSRSGLGLNMIYYAVEMFHAFDMILL